MLLVGKPTSPMEVGRKESSPLSACGLNTYETCIPKFEFALLNRYLHDLLPMSSL